MPHYTENAMTHRIDSHSVLPSEMEALELLISREGHPALVDAEGNKTVLPEAIYKTLVHIVQQMKRGHSIVLMPENETLTTQAAANYLGVSRQHLVDLLEDKKIPFHKVGSHRRIYFRDLMEYAEMRDRSRRKTLDGLYDKVKNAGKYDSSYKGS